MPNGGAVAPYPEYGIHRYKDRAAWLVYMKRNRTIFQDCFTDKAYGGKAKALKAARERRDFIVAQHPPIDPRERMEVARSVNTSGVAGVSLRVPPGTQQLYWCARTKAGGKELSRVFSVYRYGYARAFELAVEARQEQLDTLCGRPR